MTYSGPRMKLRANVRIPARVASGPGISQVIADGTLTTGLTLATLDSAGTISDPSLFRLFIYNDATQEWEYTTLDNVPTTTTGDGRTGRGDANYSILSTDRYIGLTATLTAPRTWTLPAASAVPAGTRMAINDEAGGISATNTLTFGVTGADTINGGSTFVLNAARSGVTFRSDGTSKWSVGLITTTGLADKSVTLAKQADIATASVMGRVTAGSGTPEVLTGAQFRDSILPAGAVVDFASAEYTTSAALSTLIPADDTIPQITEGTQVLSVTITPKSTTNKILLTFHAFGTAAGVEAITAALFRGSTANAIAVDSTTNASGGYRAPLSIIKVDSPATTSAVTYTIRVGGGSGSVYLNGSLTRLFGGAAAATLTATEIKA